MEFSRPGYWSEPYFPSPEDFPNPGLPHCKRILYQNPCRILAEPQGKPKNTGVGR